MQKARKQKAIKLERQMEVRKVESKDDRKEENIKAREVESQKGQKAPKV